MPVSHSPTIPMEPKNPAHCHAVLLEGAKAAAFVASILAAIIGTVLLWVGARQTEGE